MDHVAIKTTVKKNQLEAYLENMCYFFHKIEKPLPQGFSIRSFVGRDGQAYCEVSNLHEQAMPQAHQAQTSQEPTRNFLH